MKDTKIQKLYLDNGFGFPVHIINAPFRKIRGEWILDLNLEKYEKTVLLALSFKPTRLTGNEIKFIRHHFNMNLESFGKRFGDVAHSAVIKWEKSGDSSTNMNWSTEKDIRLYIINELKPKLMIEAYEKLQQIAPAKSSRIKINSLELKAA